MNLRQSTRSGRVADAHRPKPARRPRASASVVSACALLLATLATIRGWISAADAHESVTSTTQSLPAVAPAGQPVVTPPQLIDAPPVQRPDVATPAPSEVVVDLQLTIDTEGHVADVSVVHTAGLAFDDAALSAARQFRFSPAARDGAPIAVRVSYRYRFPAIEPIAHPAPAESAAADAQEASEPADETDPAASSTPTQGDDVPSFGATASVREAPRGTTRHTVSGAEAVSAPGTRGDVLRVVELLPGVARPPLGQGAIIIRGSAPADSEVSFEGTQVLRLYHFGGLTSFVNGRLVDHIDLYPGNFSTKYGRKLGGMVDVGARDPRADAWHGMIDVNIIDATLMVEGPLTKTLSVAVSARRSYIGDVLKAAASDGSLLAAPVYDDYQLFATWRPTARDRVRFLGYGSRDSLALIFKAPDQDPSLSGSGAARTYFHRAQVSWEHRQSDSVRTNMQVSAGKIGFQTDLGDALHQDISGPDLFARGELDMRLSESFQLITGVDLSNQWLDAHYRGPIIGANEGDPGQSSLTNQQQSTLDASAPFFRPAAYVEGIWRNGDGLTLIGGGRVDYFGDIKRWTFDPRITGRQTLGASTTVKAGVGLFSQPPDYGQAVPGFGNPNLLAARALHLDVGVDQAIGEGVTAGVEVFAKSMWNLVVGGSQPGMLNNDGVGRVFGAEASIKAHGTHGTAFLAYTVSRSERRDHDDSPWRLFDYDQTHILTAAGATTFGHGWQLGGAFRLVSGNPETPIVGSVYDANRDFYRPVFGAINGSRNPLYHRLDLRIEKQWHPGRVLLAAYLDLQNAYNHKNREATGYGFDYRQHADVNGLPIFPSFGLRGEL